MISGFLNSWSLFAPSYLAALFAGLLLSFLGVIVVARAQVFIAAAVAQASLLGLALDTLLGTGQPAAFAVALSVLAALATGTRAQRGGTSHEEVTAWIFLVGASGSILLLAKHPNGLKFVQAALVWAFTSDLTRVISVLVVACPCAFILATPTAMVAAISAAARLGVLIKNIADLELAARINAFIFDKTGTLTTGQLSLARLAPVEGISAAELLRLTIGAEQFSNHPTARAVARLAQEAGVPAPAATEFREAAGRGVEARVDGALVHVGRAAWLREHGVPETALTADLGEAEGHSLLYVARNGALAGWLALRDETRAESAAALRELTAAGVRRIAMVSGDRQPVAARVAKEVGCPEVAAECLPQDKVSYVRALKAKGYRVAVVGDGVNDAPALAAGDLGIAMGAAGSEVAIHSATIALMNSDLRRLPFLIELSRGARRVINQNFLIGIVFILGGLLLAGLGYLNPIIAAILHNAGSLLVVFNSARLVRLGEHLEPFTRNSSVDPSVTACAPCASSAPLPA